MTNKTRKIINLHTKLRKSTKEIAEILGMKKNSIIALLRYHNKLKPALGIYEEKKVLQWFREQGHEVIRQRGDAQFDAFIDGEMVDVKTSCLRNYPKIAPYYSFHIQYSQSKSHGNPDWYCLLMKDTQEMYKLTADQVSVTTVKIPVSLNNKYKLEYIGELKEKN